MQDTTMTQDNFCLPYNKQEQSRLLQLPDEVLLMILRQVLTNRSQQNYDGPPIEDCCEKDHKDKFDLEAEIAAMRPPEPDEAALANPIGLSSQLLSSCQMLYQIGFETLYKENVLSIVISWCNLDEAVPYESILGMSPFPHQGLGNRYTVSCEGLVITTNLRTSLTSSGRYFRFERFDHKDLKVVHSMLHRFEKVRLDVKYWADHDIPNLCRSLQGFLRHKNVVLRIAHIPELRCKKTTVIADPSSVGTRFLRCASIKFEDVPDDRVAELTGLITSNEPIYDTILMRADLDKYLRDLTSCVFEARKLYSQEEKTLLSDAAFACDFTTFSECRSTYLARTENWSRDLKRDVMNPQKHQRMANRMNLLSKSQKLLSANCLCEEPSIAITWQRKINAFFPYALGHNQEWHGWTD